MEGLILPSLISSTLSERVRPLLSVGAFREDGDLLWPQVATGPRERAASLWRAQRARPWAGSGRPRDGLGPPTALAQAVQGKTSLPTLAHYLSSPGGNIPSGRAGCGGPFCTPEAPRAGAMEAGATGEDLAGQAWLTRAGPGSGGPRLSLVLCEPILSSLLCTGG